MALGHKTLASFYLQLAQHLCAGIPLAQALHAAAGPPAADLRRMGDLIEGGGTIEQALLLAGGWLPREERALLLAAANSGRLPPALLRLSERHTQLFAIRRKAAMSCAYPLFLLQFALLIYPLLHSTLTGGKLTTGGYLLSLAEVVLPVWVLGLWLFLLDRNESPWLGRIAAWLPFFRGYSRSQALADFTFTLGNLLDAGVVIGQAWLIAGRASRSPALRTASRQIHDRIAQGEPPGATLAQHACFPANYVGLYRAGELSGQLDPNLRLLAEESQAQARHCLQIAARVYSTAVFLFVAGLIGYLVISIYAGYFSVLGSF